MPNLFELTPQTLNAHIPDQSNDVIVLRQGMATESKARVSAFTDESWVGAIDGGAVGQLSDMAAEALVQAMSKSAWRSPEQTWVVLCQDISNFLDQLALAGSEAKKLTVDQLQACLPKTYFIQSALTREDVIRATRALQQTRNLSGQVRRGVRLEPTEPVDSDEINALLAEKPDLVIVAGGAVPLHPDWVEIIESQCREHGVPFQFHGWGEWVSPAARAFGHTPSTDGQPHPVWVLDSYGRVVPPNAQEQLADQALTFECVGKLSSGRDLRGSTDAFDWPPRWHHRVALSYTPPVDEAAPVDPAHVSNEWADLATNGIQWLRNIRDGISTPEMALEDMECNLRRIRAMTEPQSHRGIAREQP